MLKKDYGLALAICDDLRRNYVSSAIEFRRGQILFHLGEYDRSEAVFREIRDNPDDRVGALCYQGLIAVARKERDKAIRIVQQIENQRTESVTKFSVDLRLASIFAGLGEIAKARELLRSFLTSSRCKAAPFLYRKYIALDRNFDPIRSDFIMPF